MTDTNFSEAGVNEVSVSSYASEPSSATGEVTEHVVTDENGNEVATEATEGREFYTIETASEKVFYLIVDRDANGDGTAYFLTEVSESDLLNAVDTSANEKNDSAAIEAALSGGDSSTTGEGGAGAFDETDTGDGTEAGEATAEGSNEATVEATTEGILSQISTEALGSYVTYGICGVVIAVVLVVAILLKKKKAKENFVDDDEEEEELFEDYDNEEETEEDIDDDFLNNTDDEED